MPNSGGRPLNLIKTDKTLQILPALLLIGCLSFVAIACSGDDDDANGDQETREELLSLMTLTEDDLGSYQLNEISRSFSSNDDVAQNAANPDDVANRIAAWERLLGISVSFLVDPQATEAQTFLGIQSDATLFMEDRGARLSYQFDVDRAREAEPADVGLAEVELKEVDAPNVGEEAYWLRITGLTTDDVPSLSVVDQILFRQGNVVGLLRVDSLFLADAPRNSGEGQVLLWAQTLSRRVEDALAE
jgi:hypothetical protein